MPQFSHPLRDSSYLQCRSRRGKKFIPQGKQTKSDLYHFYKIIKWFIIKAECYWECRCNISNVQSSMKRSNTFPPWLYENSGWLDRGCNSSSIKKNAIGISYNFKYVFPVNEASLLSLRSLEDASVIILINDSYAHSRHVTENCLTYVFLCSVTEHLPRSSCQT